MYRLLIADKDKDRAENLAAILCRNGFSASVIKDGSASLKKYVKRHRPDALIIIHSFSEKKTLALISQSKKSNLPVMFVCKKDTCCPRLIKVLSDAVFEVGEYEDFCLHYLGMLEEKLNQIKHNGSFEKGICYGMFYADTVKNIIYFGNKRLELTPTEFQIMTILILARGEVVSKSEIMKQIWGTSTLNTNSLSVHLQRLKKRLNSITKNYRITTVRGKGIKLEKIEQ